MNGYVIVMITMIAAIVAVLLAVTAPDDAAPAIDEILTNDPE